VLPNDYSPPKKEITVETIKIIYHIKDKVYIKFVKFIVQNLVGQVLQKIVCTQFYNYAAD